MKQRVRRSKKQNLPLQFVKTSYLCISLYKQTALIGLLWKRVSTLFGGNGRCVRETGVFYDVQYFSAEGIKRESIVSKSPNKGNLMLNEDRHGK